MAEYHYCLHLHHDGDVNVYDNGDHAAHRRLNYDGHRGVLHNVVQFAIDQYPDLVIDLVAESPDILRALDRRRDAP